MGKGAIVIAGGGTGGHVYPGLAVADELRRRRPDLAILFVGTRGGLEAKIVPEAGYPLRFVHAGGIVGKRWLVRLLNAGLVPLGTLQAAGIVMREGAGVVLGVGGYASGPVVMAGKLLRRRTMVMEQNAIPGSTNRILAPLVDRVAVSFPSTAGLLQGKVVVTGNPVRAGMAGSGRSTRPGSWNLLVFGGSRGAHGLNQAMIRALPQLEDAPRPLTILHQTGPADLEEVQAAYRRTGLAARVVPYIHTMAEAYAAADLVVCRAGATTVAELSATGRAAVMIPLPHATGGHQEQNARELEARGAAVMVQEKEAGAGELATKILALLKDNDRRTRMEEAARSLGSPGAAAAVADLVLELYERKNRRTAAGNGRPL